MTFLRMFRNVKENILNLVKAAFFYLFPTWIIVSDTREDLPNDLSALNIRKVLEALLQNVSAAKNRCRKIGRKKPRLMALEVEKRRS